MNLDATIKDGFFTNKSKKCPACKGSGKEDYFGKKRRCTVCFGSGKSNAIQLL